MILENVGQHEHVYSYLWRMVLELDSMFVSKRTWTYRDNVADIEIKRPLESVLRTSLR